MNAKNRADLLKLADLLDTLPSRVFNYGDFISGDGTITPEQALEDDSICGTAACAVGWMPKLWPEVVQWTPNKGRYASWSDLRATGGGYFGIEAASNFFGIPYNDGCHLFDPSASTLGCDASPSDVAQHIRNFVAKQKEFVDA